MRLSALAALVFVATYCLPFGANAMVDPITREPLVVRQAAPEETAPGYTSLGYATPSRPGAGYAVPSYARPDAAGLSVRTGSVPREIIDFPSREAPGTILISTDDRRLYYVLGAGKALRYGIGVGRDGFQWGGTHSVTQKREWPTWTPPGEMRERQPFLPNFMPGGPNNPLGARAMYLGSTLYRIHGSNEPQTIGAAVSSGCFRMTNEDVIDLYDRVKVGSKVVVMR